MILYFRDKRTATVYLGRLPKGFPPDLLIAARRKLRYLDVAATLGDLRSPPGNRLEALSGDRAGQHSIAGERPVSNLLYVARRKCAGC